MNWDISGTSANAYFTYERLTSFWLGCPLLLCCSELLRERITLVS